MNERLFIIFIANTVNNYASRGGILYIIYTDIQFCYNIKIQGFFSLFTHIIEGNWMALHLPRLSMGTFLFLQYSNMHVY